MSGAPSGDGAPEQSSAQPEASAPSCSQKVDESGDEEAMLRQLLTFLYNYEDRKMAIAAACQAVLSLQETTKGPPHKDSEATDFSEEAASSSRAGLEPPPFRRAASEGGINEPSSREGSQDAERTDSQGLNKAAAPCMLEEFPNCRKLIDAYRKLFRIPNKTPLSVLYEYASRLNFELVFEESQDSAGAFTMESSLKDMDGSALYEPGRGTARAKRDAKQLAAASLLEILLKSVPFKDLLYKSDKQQQQKDIQQASRLRWQMAGKGRGGFRGSGRAAGPPPLRQFAGHRQNPVSPLHMRGGQLAGMGTPFVGSVNVSPAEGSGIGLGGLMNNPQAQVQHDLLLGMPVANTSASYLGAGQIGDPPRGIPAFGAQHGGTASSFGIYEAITQAMIAGLPDPGVPMGDLGSGLAGLAFDERGQLQQLASGQANILNQGLLEFYQATQQDMPHFQEQLFHQQQQAQPEQSTSGGFVHAPRLWRDPAQGPF